ncbi:MAG TPA: hypothetical protein HA222_01890 [Candidatus Diapherotrites archaeon]|uniref:4-vinyl reductase 4VR domain-containing protein n=1 Tax=Candidatus Iainarchaeum sp. TaxID=3101447 RepID=A0A7J4JUL6_9ARCH|nr:hypothetical protein [Candidatus Diapherotrites archaeon]
MYAFLSKLLISGKLKFDAGRIIAFDEPFTLVPMISIKKMTDDAISRGLPAVCDLYFYGWAYGYAVTKELIKLFKLKQFEERYKISMDVASMVGFGDYQTLSFKRGDHAKFKVVKNPFALQYHPSKDSFCHYLRGMEAGGGTLVHETLMNNIEFECAATNGQYCLHANLNRENISKVPKELIDKQLDVEYLKKRQTDFVREMGDDPSKLGL